MWLQPKLVASMILYMEKQDKESNIKYTTYII